MTSGTEKLPTEPGVCLSKFPRRDRLLSGCGSCLRMNQRKRRKLMEKRVLLTGHNGHIGSVMTPLSFGRVMKLSVWIRDTLARVRWCLTVSAPSVCKIFAASTHRDPSYKIGGIKRIQRGFWSASFEFGVVALTFSSDCGCFRGPPVSSVFSGYSLSIIQK